MMFSASLTSLVCLLAGAIVVQGATVPRGFAAHKVTINNRCGSGQAKWAVPDNKKLGGKDGTTKVNEDISGAVAWIDGYKSGKRKCGEFGKGCGVVKFSLINSQGMPHPSNDAHYDIQTGKEEGQHHLIYPMRFEFTDSKKCKKTNPPACTFEECEEAAYKDDWNPKDTSRMCWDEGAGIKITFC